MKKDEKCVTWVSAVWWSTLLILLVVAVVTQACDRTEAERSYRTYDEKLKSTPVTQDRIVFRGDNRFKVVKVMDYYESGMHYQVVRVNGSDVEVVNVTADSLLCKRLSEPGNLVTVKR